MRIILTNMPTVNSGPQTGGRAATHREVWPIPLLSSSARTGQSLPPGLRTPGQPGSFCHTSSGHNWQSWTRRTSAGSSCQWRCAPEPGACWPGRRLLPWSSLWGGTPSPSVRPLRWRESGSGNRSKRPTVIIINKIKGFRMNEVFSSALNSHPEKKSSKIIQEYRSFCWLTLTRSVWVSYSKMRIPGLLAPSLTPGSVVFQGVTPGLRNMVLMGAPTETQESSMIYTVSQ